jgi:DNA-directed RNA polymerase specialized sigma subunit
MDTVLTRIAALALATEPTRGEKDIAAWRAWKKAPTDASLSALLHQVDPLIQREANSWQASLARPLLEAEGKRLAVMAFNNYDPDRGAALGTHVANYLKKMSRLAYANQNVARLPENKMLMFHTYNVGHAQLSDQLGRAPTTDELADHLGWSMKHLTTFQRQTAHQEILESGGNAEDESNPVSSVEAEKSDHMVDFIHHDLPPSQKAIFEHLTGYGGTKTLSNQQVMKKLKMTQGQYSYQKRLLVQHLEKVTAGK